MTNGRGISCGGCSKAIGESTHWMVKFAVWSKFADSVSRVENAHRLSLLKLHSQLVFVSNHDKIRKGINFLSWLQKPPQILNKLCFELMDKLLLVKLHPQT